MEDLHPFQFEPLCGWTTNVFDHVGLQLASGNVNGHRSIVANLKAYRPLCLIVEKVFEIAANKVNLICKNMKNGHAMRCSAKCLPNRFRLLQV